MNLIEITRHVAIEAKASGFGTPENLGCFYDDEWNLSDEQWNRVCDMVVDILPAIEKTFPRELAISRASWASVHVGVRAEDRAQRIAFASEGPAPHAY